MIYKFDGTSVKDEDENVIMECPIVRLEKALSIHDMEIKRDKEGNTKIDAILSEVEKIDSDGDIIKEGAFDESIKGLSHLKMLKMHSRHDIIGRWSNLKMDGKMLKAEGTIYDGEKMGYDLARMTRSLIDTGDMAGVSVGFKLKVWQSVNDKEADRYGWDIYNLELMEASIVDIPANDSAKVTSVKAELMRSIELNRKDKYEREFLDVIKGDDFFRQVSLTLK